MSEQRVPVTYTCDMCGATSLPESSVNYVRIEVGRHYRGGTGEYAPHDGYEEFDVCDDCIGGNEALKRFQYTQKVEEPARRLMGWLFPKKETHRVG